MSRFAVWVFALLAVTFGSAQALAAASASLGHAVLRAPSGDRVELGYSPDGELLVGEFFIRNDGSGPLEVSRIAIYTTPNDPRTPPGLTVELDKAKAGSPQAPGQVLLAPGEERRALLKWRFAGSRAKSLHAAVLVETSGRGATPSEPGGPLVMPVHAERLNGLGVLGARAVSFVVFFPVVSVLLALLLRVSGKASARALGLASTLVHGVLLAVVALLASRFDALFTRADGEDGYQFVERSVLSASLGIEYFLGLDGFSLVLVAATVLVSFAASIASIRLREGAFSYHVLSSVVVTSALGVLVSLDGFVLSAFFALGVLPSFGLVARKDSFAARRAGARLLWSSLLSLLLLVFGVWLLWQSSDSTYLVSGEAAYRTSLLTELGRVAWVSKKLSVWGLHGLKVVWTCLFLAFALRLSAVPFPGFVADAHAESDTPTSVLFSGVFFSTAVLGLLRFNVGVLPDAMRWAAPGISVLGVVMVIVSALAALREVDARRFVGRVSTAQAGFVLVGLGSLTPQGIEGALTLGLSESVIAALFFLAIGARGERERDWGRLSSLFSRWPRLRALGLLCLLASLGLPLLLGFWGPMLALWGMSARAPMVAFFASFALIVLAAAHVFAFGPVLFGQTKEQVSSRPADEALPLGAAFWASALPLALAVLVLGLLPRIFLGFADQRSLELHRLLDPPGASQIS